MRFFQNQRTEQLLRHLEEFCKRGRGQQNLAAIYCQCSPSTVCDWLHGRKQPTGEQALALRDLLYSGNPTRYWRPIRICNTPKPPYHFKKVVTVLDREFFQSKSYTLEAKQEFVVELIHWLENQRKNLRA